MRIKLINMPFASLPMPSLALTQLASVLSEHFGDSIQVDTVYLNLDFADYFDGQSFYNRVFVDAGFMTGLGDWFFRQSAFPDLPDNAEAYFGRFYFGEDESSQALRRTLLEKREGLDAFLGELIARYDLASADIVGFTGLFSQTVASFAMARRLKAVNARIVTCMGGAACEGVAGRVFARLVDAMDYVFSGPALVNFPQFVGHMQGGDRGACESLKGVFSRSNLIDAGGDAALLGEELDINANIMLDYCSYLDAVDRAFPAGELRPVLLFETSRGCYWAEKMVCTFCGLNGLQCHYRPMTAENALAQIRSLRQWVHRCSAFIAVDTAMPRNYVNDLFPLMNREPGPRIMYEVRTDLGEADLTTMIGAGVVALQPGIEALSTSSLKLMRKGTTAFRNIRFLKACSKFPISLDWNLLICSPGETEAVYEKYLRDMPLLYHLAPPTGVYPIMFVRYSRYAQNPEAYGLDLRPQDFYGLTYPFEEAIIRDMANHFVDSRADTEMMDRWLAKLNEAVARWRRRWQGSDGEPQARLCFFDDGSSSTVYDSRSGKEVEHRLTPVDVQILGLLDRPRRLQDIVPMRADLAPEDVDAGIASLKARGLLFEENSRYASLVT